MGPRPNGRGKGATVIIVPAGAEGVNGAAAKRPRKDRDDLQGGGRRDASMGPRPNGRGKHGVCHARIGGVQRQWGRGQTAAERARRDEKGAIGNTRQWGRGQTAAESLLRQGSCEPDPCVNGAAAKRPRKVRKRGYRPSPIVASMGPRPNGRGKRHGVIMTIRARTRQWGRGQTAAERARPAACSPGASCVNGAAAKRPRKGSRRAAGRGRDSRVNGAAAKRPRKVHSVG